MRLGSRNQLEFLKFPFYFSIPFSLQFCVDKVIVIAALVKFLIDVLCNVVMDYYLITSDIIKTRYYETLRLVKIY